MTRLDTYLESSGAEFLVLGHLLIEGIQAFKAYRNFPGYDLVATSPETNRSCRIQVKSRWATDFDGGFPIKNFECDFVVFVALNRGLRYHKTKSRPEDATQKPDIFVFPVDVIRNAQRPGSAWGKVFLRDIETVEQYVDNWDAIKVFLEFRSIA
jgi:hypothetical protein